MSKTVTRSHKRAGQGLALGLAALEKISAVEGLKLRRECGTTLRRSTGKRMGPEERTRFIVGKYGNEIRLRGMYEAIADPYCYPGTTVLKNIPGLRSKRHACVKEAAPTEIAGEASGEGIHHGQAPGSARHGGLHVGLHGKARRQCDGAGAGDHVRCLGA